MIIKLQFSMTAGLASEAIRIFERGWPSHVDAVLADGSLLGARSDAIGGEPPGVRVRPPRYETWVRTQVISLVASPDHEAAWLAFLTAQLGKPYDMLAIAAFAVGRDWRQPDSWFCSELQAAALEACGWLPKPLADAASEITPRDLLLVVSPWGLP